MGVDKQYDGYVSFSYLEAGKDFKEFDLTDELAPYFESSPATGASS